MSAADDPAPPRAAMAPAISDEKRAWLAEFASASEHVHERQQAAETYNAASAAFLSAANDVADALPDDAPESLVSAWTAFTGAWRAYVASANTYHDVEDRLRDELIDLVLRRAR